MSQGAAAEQRETSALKKAEYQATIFVYFLYTVVIWFFYILDLNEIANGAQGCVRPVGSIMVICEKSSSFGLIRHLSVANWLFTVALSIHTLRIFCGIHFISNDSSFNAAKDRILSKLTGDQRLRRKVADAVMILLQVFLLGVLAYFVKSNYVRPTTAIMLLQMILIIWFDWYNRRVFLEDENKVSTVLILFEDLVLFLISFLFFANTFAGFPSVDHIDTLLRWTIVTIVLIFVLELIFAWGQSLISSITAFTRLISGLVSAGARRRLIE